MNATMEEKQGLVKEFVKDKKVVKGKWKVDSALTCPPHGSRHEIDGEKFFIGNIPGITNLEDEKVEIFYLDENIEIDEEGLQRLLRSKQIFQFDKESHEPGYEVLILITDAKKIRQIIEWARKNYIDYFDTELCADEEGW